MIPRADLTVSHDIDASKLFTPDAGTVEYPYWLGIIHHHEPGIWNAATWEDAETFLELERDAMRDRDTRAADAEEFEELLDELYGDVDLAGSGCDFGIGAAVWALNAAGLITASSCSGHVDGGPEIFVAADPARAKLLAGIAGATGCGVDNLRGGLQVWAPSIREILELAAGLIRSRAAFDQLQLPAPRDHAAEDDADW